MNNSVVLFYLPHKVKGQFKLPGFLAAKYDIFRMVVGNLTEHLEHNGIIPALAVEGSDYHF